MMIMIMIIIVVIKHFVRRILSVLELNSRRYFVVKEMNSVEMPKEIVVSTLTRNVCEERADSSRGGLRPEGEVCPEFAESKRSQ